MNILGSSQNSHVPTKLTFGRMTAAPESIIGLFPTKRFIRKPPHHSLKL